MPEPLMSTDELAARIGTPDLVVLDASWHMPASGRSARGEYEAGHIPGAVFFDIDDLSDPASGLPHTLPSPDDFAADMGTLGIGEDMAIVVYESEFPFASPRAWWMLRMMGAGDVRVLDGGLGKWRAEGRQIASGKVARPRTTFTPRLATRKIVDLAAMRRLVGTSEAQVVDARSPARFAGREAEPRPGVRAGHMPGAVNMHYASFRADDGTMKPQAELKALFDRAGVDIDRPVVTTCGSGVTACVPVLALALLGRDSAAVYDGSWSEWGALSDTAIAAGETD